MSHIFSEDIEKEMIGRLIKFNAFPYRRKTSKEGGPIMVIMVIDVRDLSLSEAFCVLRDVVSRGFTSSDEVSVLVDAHNCKELDLIIGFVEILLECKTRVVEANGYYIVKICQEPVAETCSEERDGGSHEMSASCPID